MTNFPDTRFEIKITTRPGSLPQVRALVMSHPAAFSTAYPPRRVNNVYFDTPDLQCLEEHLSGCVQRVKVRFRWYGDCVRTITGVLECKHKRDRLGWKESSPVATRMDFTTMTWDEIVRTIHRDISPQHRLALGRRPLPLFINSYMREYYVSRSRGVRITLDYDNRGFGQRSCLKPCFHLPLPLVDGVVVEFKAKSDERRNLEAVLDSFPLRPSRNSKFVNCAHSLMR